MKPINQTIIICRKTGDAKLSKCSNRLSHIDLIKSIAIFFVVFYHGTIYKYDFLNDGSALNYFGYLIRTVLSTAVPLFFVVNGYLLFRKDIDYKKHYLKTLRIAGLTVFWGLVYIVVSTLKSGEPLNIVAIIDDFLSWNRERGIHFLWFLSTLVCIYILFPALKALFDKSSKAFLAFTIICFAFTIGLSLVNASLEFIGTVLHHWFGEIIYSDGILRFYPLRGMEVRGFAAVYFCLGGILYKTEDRIVLLSRKTRIILPIVALIASCCMLFANGVFESRFILGSTFDVVYTGYDSVFTFINVICIYLLCLNYRRNNIIIEKISSNTLGIYFTHSLLIFAFAPIITQWIFAQNVFCNIVYSLLILMLCLLISLIIKKIPILNTLL